MTEAQLNAFIQVAELRSFTAAALSLGMTQSAVSHAIKGLETSLGVQVLVRDKGGIELTPVGQQVLYRAREVVNVYEAMRQEAASVKGLSSGTLRIGSFGPTVALKLLPTLLSAYQQAYPNIDVYLDEGTDQAVLQWLQDRRVDVGFVTLPQESFETLPIMIDQMVAVVHRQHPLAASEEVALSSLCDDPFILTEAGSAHIVMGLFSRQGWAPNIRYRSAQVISTLAHVSRNEGVTILAESALPTTQGDVAYCIKPLSPRQPRHVGVAYKTRLLSPAAKAFVALCRKQAVSL